MFWLKLSIFLGIWFCLFFRKKFATLFQLFFCLCFILFYIFQYCYLNSKSCCCIYYNRTNRRIKPQPGYWTKYLNWIVLLLITITLYKWRVQPWASEQQRMMLTCTWVDWKTDLFTIHISIIISLTGSVSSMIHS